MPNLKLKLLSTTVLVFGVMFGFNANASVDFDTYTPVYSGDGTYIVEFVEVDTEEEADFTTYETDADGNLVAVYYTYSYEKQDGSTWTTDLLGTDPETTDNIYYWGSGANNSYGYMKNTTDIESISGVFINHYINSLEGAGHSVIENYGNTDSIEGSFIGNVLDGSVNSIAGSTPTAIVNEGTIGSIAGDFIDNGIINVSSYNWGGVIRNNYNYIEGPEIGTITANFINNYITTDSGSIKGVVIYNNYAEIDIITGSSFIGNWGKALYSANGGVIYNYSGTIGKISNTDFISNSITSTASYAYGGVIYNSGTIDAISNSNFINNSTESSSSSANGGAIYNNGKINTISNSNFINNSASATSSSSMGGAILNYDYIDTISGSSFYYNSADYGGAIVNHNYKTINYIIDSVFSGNSAYYGGAIYNAYIIYKLEADFSNNISTSNGGAIYNQGNIGYLSGYFDSNISGNRGGAIYNISDALTVTNSSFVDNYATNYGGAIYSSVNLTIIADNYTSLFQGNSTSTDDNAICINNSEATLTLNAVNGGSIVLYDSINGAEGYTIDITGDSTSSVEIYSDLFDANLIIGEEISSDAQISTASSTSDDTFMVNIYDPSYISSSTSLVLNDDETHIYNYGTTNLTLNSLTMNGGKLFIHGLEADLLTKTTGILSAEEQTGGSANIYLSDVSVLTDSIDDVTHVLFADSDILAAQTISSIEEALGPVYQYSVEYDSETGELIFTRGDEVVVDNYNPEVFTSAVATVAAVSAVSNELYSKILTDADRLTTCEGCDRLYGGAFATMFGSNDDIDIKGFSGADTDFYGVIGGVNSDVFTADNGIKSTYSIYAAYAYGETEFNNQTIEQDSFYLGVGANFYKGNFFVANTGTIGMTRNNETTGVTDEKFNSYQIGMGTKIGYTYNLNDSVFIVPSIYGSYTFIDVNDYTTTRGADVKFGNFHNFELAPELKIKKSFDEGYKGYALTRYVKTFNHGQDSTANNIELPDVELEDYFEYGIGVEKENDEGNAFGFVELKRREGGREGWYAQVGIKYNFD